MHQDMANRIYSIYKSASFSCTLKLFIKIIGGEF